MELVQTGLHRPTCSTAAPVPARQNAARPSWRQRFGASALAACLALLFPTLAAAWGFEDVAKLAAERAARPWQAPAQGVPSELAELSYDQLRDIRFRRDRTLWRSQALPFDAAFFHVGRQGESVRIHEVSPTGVKEVAFSPADYDYGRNTLDASGWNGLGHAGFRVLNHLNSPNVKDELIVFLGASYFRALGAGQRYGLSARGLAVDTTGPAEEFPRFTEFWLERPAPRAASTRLWALLDSPRVAGAYAFEVLPGQNTQVKVQARLFLRATDQPIRTLGIAPLTSMFFFGENQPRPGDFRPEVHDSDGLMMASVEGEWLWRPLVNPATPQVNTFRFKGIRGFGLMQRDRAFANYEDTEARYEMRPSAWVTPVGDWGPGRVELYQFHTPDETHDNIAAYWVPDQLPAPGQPLDIAYVMSWQGEQQQRPPGGWAVQSRRGLGYLPDSAGPREQQVQYVVDFAGPALDALPETAPVKAIASSNENGRVLESLVYRNPITRTWRMTLRVERRQAAQPIELRAFLQHGNDALTETWTTLITP